MRRVRRVAHEDDILVRPVGVLDRDKVAPQRAVLEQRVPLKLLLEQLFAERDGLALSRPIQVCAAPGCLRGLNDEGRMALLVLISVHAPQTVLVALEVESEGGEG